MKRGVIVHLQGYVPDDLCARQMVLTELLKHTDVTGLELVSRTSFEDETTLVKIRDVDGRYAWLDEVPPACLYSTVRLVNLVARVKEAVAAEPET